MVFTLRHNRCRFRPRQPPHRHRSTTRRGTSGTGRSESSKKSPRYNPDGRSSWRHTVCTSGTHTRAPPGSRSISDTRACTRARPGQPHTPCPPGREVRQSMACRPSRQGDPTQDNRRARPARPPRRLGSRVWCAVGLQVDSAGGWSRIVCCSSFSPFVGVYTASQGSRCEHRCSCRHRFPRLCDLCHGSLLIGRVVVRGRV
jgi:hypothetical protein